MPPRILVVDDDPMIRRLVRLNFELEGFDVLEASGGADALRAVDDESPDLVVCDVMMPDVSGLDVLTTLRKSPRHARLPVVMLSARAQKADVRRGLEAGADEYVTKPFDPDDLIDVVKRLLSRKAGKPHA